MLASEMYCRLQRKYRIVRENSLGLGNFRPYFVNFDSSWKTVASTSSQQPVKLIVISRFWWCARYSILARVTQWQSFRINLKRDHRF